MGGEQAAKVLLQIEKASLKKQQATLEADDEARLLDSITSAYDRQTDPTYAAARLWVDAIIDPEETRRWVGMGIEVADASPSCESFRPGVLQT